MAATKQKTKIEPGHTGFLEIDTAVFQSMLLLPEGYQILGATCNLSNPGKISLLIRVTGEEILEAKNLAIPLYEPVEIEGKTYTNLKEIEWISAYQQPASDQITLPRWLIDPYDQRLPWSSRDSYRALLYKSMQMQTETLSLAEGELQKLLHVYPSVEIRDHLNRLRNAGYVQSWQVEGEHKEKRWIITVKPPIRIS